MKIFLKKNEDRRLLLGHQWVFSNEIERVEDFSPDEVIADLYNFRGKFLGRGFYNKNSLIAFRLLTTSYDETIDINFFSKRIKDAYKFREQYTRNNSAFRLVYGESDFLPGLVIDKYNDLYSIQIFSKGMDYFKDIIVDILVKELNADAVIFKNNFPYRKMEGLDLYESVAFSKSNCKLETVIELDGLKYNIDLLSGQKTGHFLDQVDNRLKLRRFIKPSDTVLDLFCNDGGFSMNAAIAGANEIIAVDISSQAISQMRSNFEINNLNCHINFYNKDVFDFLKEEIKSGRNYDVVILDPPSLTKSKKDLKNATNAYIRLNSQAFSLCKTGGIVFTFSCSGIVSETLFREIIVHSAKLVSRKVRVIDYSLCSFDHCFLPQMEETIYLKAYLLYII
jgi:23S rRNA (cytosine1962-C5)-methyltransferase